MGGFVVGTVSISQVGPRHVLDQRLWKREQIDLLKNARSSFSDGLGKFLQVLLSLGKGWSSLMCIKTVLFLSIINCPWKGYGRFCFLLISVTVYRALLTSHRRCLNRCWTGGGKALLSLFSWSHLHCRSRLISSHSGKCPSSHYLPWIVHQYGVRVAQG